MAGDAASELRDVQGGAQRPRQLTASDESAPTPRDGSDATLDAVPHAACVRQIRTYCGRGLGRNAGLGRNPRSPVPEAA